MLETGQQVDRYTIESIIGYGGTAVVYLVSHSQLSTQHALKVLSVSSQAIRERMLREGRVQAAMHHSNVVGVTDVIDVDGSPGLLMEYISGPALDTALESYKLSLEHAESLFKGIVHGVRAAHLHGLVHRDLKPANVLLVDTPDGYQPKVTDFGLAKVLAGEGQEVGTTRAGIAMGTPSYMSPEQVRDARQVDQRADVFSLGCLLYEVITGHRAFPGEQALDIYNAVTRGEYIPAVQLIPDLPSRFSKCIDGCLAIQLEERIPDCNHLLKVLAGELDWEVSPHPVPEELDFELTTSDGPFMEVAKVQLEEARSGQSANSWSSDHDEAWAEAQSSSRGKLRGLLVLALALLVLLGIGIVGVGSSFFWNLATVGGFSTPLDEVSSSEVSSSDLSTAQVSNEVLSQASSTEETPPSAVPVVDSESEAKPNEESSPPGAVSPRKPKDRTETKSRRSTSNSSSSQRKSASIQVKVLSVPPNAVLDVDGQNRGRTNKKLKLPLGRHRIHLQSGDQQGSFGIRVQDDNANKWCYDFARAKVYKGSCPKQ